MDKDHKGREPISGLRFGGSVPKKYLSETQDRILQGWLCSYFNEPGQCYNMTASATLTY